MSSGIEQFQRMIESAQKVRERPASRRSSVDQIDVRVDPLQRAKNAILLRHRRKGYFDDDLFMDPAWDMLLHLYVAYEEGDAISISRCCAATPVPRVAALRWMDVLRDRGLVRISGDDGDQSRRFVRLTDPAHHAMRDFWQEQIAV